MRWWKWSKSLCSTESVRVCGMWMRSEGTAWYTSAGQPWRSASSASDTARLTKRRNSASSRARKSGFDATLIELNHRLWKRSFRPSFWLCAA